MKTILLSRHGQTAHNLQRICSGQNAIDLTAEGKVQAHALGKAILKYEVEAIFASDQLRARSTVEEFCLPVNCKIFWQPELRERRFGALEGATIQAFNNERDRSPLGPSHFRPEGGESPNDIRLRLLPLADSIISSPFNSLVIVGHLVTNCCLLAHWLGGTPEQYSQSQCCLNVLRYTPLGGVKAIVLNSTDHLASTSLECR